MENPRSLKRDFRGSVLFYPLAFTSFARSLYGIFSPLRMTYTALIFSVSYLLKYVVAADIFNAVFTLTAALVAVLNILSIKIIKPKGAAYIFFSLLAAALLVLYLGVL